MTTTDDAFVNISVLALSGFSASSYRYEILFATLSYVEHHPADRMLIANTSWAFFT